MNNDSLNALRARDSIIRPTGEVVTDRIDEFMTRGDSERPWQVFELTQNQDVTQWIANPAAIELIPPVLADLARRLRGLPGPRPIRLLDVGCYGGYAFDYLRNAFADTPGALDYTGVDVQPAAVEAARLAHAGLADARFEVGDVFRLTATWPTPAFDVVLAYRVLHHLPHFEQCLAQLAGVARHFVHLALPLAERDQCQRMEEISRTDQRAVHSYFRHFSADTVRRAAAAAGCGCEIIPNPNSPYATVVCVKKA